MVRGTSSGRSGSDGVEYELAGGKGKLPGWAETVDRLLDASPRYSIALRAAFMHFQQPNSAPVLHPQHLLPALEFFLQRISQELDPKAGKLCLRPVTQEDIDASLRVEDCAMLERPISIGQFDRIARNILKRVALDRGKRLGLFMLGGILVVHMTKSVVKKIPFIGPPIGAFVNILVPTLVAGPAVGVAGAMYL